MNIANRDLKKIRENYNNMPHGDERVAAIQSAVRMADELKNYFWQMQTRYDEMREQWYHGDAGKILPLASEIVTLFGERPSRTYAGAYIAVLEMAVGQWEHLPQLPIEQWEELMVFFENAVQYYQMKYGHYYWRSFFMAVKMGQKDVIEEIWQKWQKRHDMYCSGCEQRFLVLYAAECGDGALAEQMAQPLLNKSISCEAEPKATLKILLEFALDYETKEKAAYWAKQLRPHLFNETNEMEHSDEMLRWLAYENPKEGLQIIERDMLDYLKLWSQSDKFDFFRAAWVLCNNLPEKSVWLKLPKEFPLWREDGQYQSEELADWFYQQALEIAYAFERRDKYPYYRKKLERANHLSELDKK